MIWLKASPSDFLYLFETHITLDGGHKKTEHGIKKQSMGIIKQSMYLVSFCTLWRDFGVSCASSCAKMDSLKRDPPDEFIPGEADDANDGRGRPPFDISKNFKNKKISVQPDSNQ